MIILTVMKMQAQNTVWMALFGTLRMALLAAVISTMAESQPTMATVLHVESANNFCERSQDILECIFKDTDQAVEMSSVAAGIRDVRLESASTFRGQPPCGTHLQIWSSTNVTVLGTDATTRVLIDTTSGSPPDAPHLNRSPKDNGEGAIEARNDSFAGNEDSTEVLRDIITSLNKASEPKNADLRTGRDVCIGNVSVHQSRIHRIDGTFDLITLQSNTVQDIDGTFNKIVIRGSAVSTASIVGDVVSIVKTSIENLRQLKIQNLDQLQGASFGQVINPGIIIQHSANRERTDSSSDHDFSGHEIANVKIVSLLEGQLKVSGSQLSMNNISIDKVGPGVIVIEKGSKVIINNMSIQNGSRRCLVLRGEARIILNNFYLEGKTISYFEMSSKIAEKAVFPLLAAWPVRTQVRVKKIEKEGTNGASDDEQPTEFIGMKWYWIGIMALVGLVSGIVVGTAIMWRKTHNKPKGLSSSLTLAEILAREREEEESRCNTYVGPQRPDLIRQDSGLTSSSFGSFSVEQDRRRASNRHPENLDHILLNTQEPNVFIQVSPTSCSGDEVIYEEVDTLSLNKENIYMVMK